MKRVLLLSLVTSSLLLGNEKPMAIGLAMAYMNNIVEFPSQQYDQIRKNAAHVKVNVDILESRTYAISNFSAAYVWKDTAGIHAALPLLSNNESGNKGVGDAMVSATLNIGSFVEEEWLYSNVFGIRYTFDNGEAEDGLGSGSQAFSIFWDTSGYLGKGFDGFASLMWTYYAEKVNGATPGDEDTGWIGLKHKCLLSEKIETNFKFNWQTKYSSVFQNGYNLVDATIEWQSDKLFPMIPMKAGLKIPVWDSSEVNNEFSIFLGIGGTF